MKMMSDNIHVKAMDFACRAHRKQQYGEMPYVRHLAHVALVLAQHGFSDDQWLAAGWLHDSIEDAGVTHDDISRQFGSYVAQIVWAVTDGVGRNRAERHAASFRKMIKFPDAIILKLADRIANVESSIASDKRLLGMYRKEYPEFCEQLRVVSFGVDGCRTRVYALWSYLDDLIQPPQLSVEEVE